MCGIAGIWHKTWQNNGIAEVKKMTDAIAHRGPDGEGHIQLDNDTLYFGHRRLSIIDLSDAGKQPMQYIERYTITYNGEIYNYLELRDTLQSKGYRFNTATDTEVIMAAYDYWGVTCLNYFDGMFAFAIYDNHKKELFCARDRFGEKPFHYFQGEDFFAFASEMKSLWAVGVDSTPDDYSIYLFINMNLHEDPEDNTRTFYRYIKKLKPGHYFILKREGSVVQKCYWKLDPLVKNDEIGFEDACIRFRELFETSIMRRLRSDVPVGTSLSGGLDSSAVALVMHKLRNKNATQKCFSVRFNDPLLDEGYFMKKVIEGTQIELIETWPSTESLIANFEKIMYHQEEPFGSASIYAQWEVFRLAKENKVTVLLDGQGADEILAGYTHFFTPFFREIYRKKGGRALQMAYHEYLINNYDENRVNIDWQFKIESLFPIIHKAMRTIIRKLSGVGAVAEIDPELHNAFKKRSSPFVVHNELNESLRYFTTVSGLSKLLRFADRNAMAHSREVRLPFLSHELVEFVFSLPAEYKIRNGWTKAPIRFGLSDILPREIIWRKNKLGFQPPQKEWENQPDFIEFAMECKKIAVQKGYICDSAPLLWKTISIGTFLKMHQQ